MEYKVTYHYKIGNKECSESQIIPAFTFGDALQFAEDCEFSDQRRDAVGYKFEGYTIIKAAR